MALIKLNIRCLAQVPVTVAGTRVPLSAAPLQVSNVVIQWDPSNIGDVYVGGDDVASSRCIKLNGSNPVCEITVDDTESDEDRAVVDLSEIYVDAANSSDKVNVAYVEVTSKNYNG